jgi:AraC-like DNA-binding protein
MLRAVALSLWSYRRTEIAALGAWLSTAARVWSRGRLHAVDNAAVVSEDALSVRAFARAGHLRRPVATVLLDGAARVSFGRDHHWLDPGAVLVAPEKSDLLMRQEGARYRSLVLEWEPAWLGPSPDRVRDARVPDGHLPALRALADALHAGAAPLGALFDALGDAGLAFAPGADLDEPAPPQHQRLCATLDALLSDLSRETLKSALDERMGLSARQFQRLVTEFHRRYGFNATSWLDARNRRRLLVGAAFLTAPGATAAAVAPAMGFTSAAAFSKALVNAGLPRPRDVASVVSALRPGDVRE